MEKEFSDKRTTIRFILNGTPVVIDFNSNSQMSPHMTVMRYLREFVFLTGTKEGCGIGDCGACTVCIIERDANQNIAISSVNGCLMMLGMLDNKHIVTIEGVAKNGKLHPVQQSLVEKRGAQCGFCSPGMVMSSYVHYLNKKPFTKREIENSLSGNLCRCTGYQSIISALKDVEKYERTQESFELPVVANDELYVENGENVYIKPLTLGSLLKYKERFPQYSLVSGASDISVKFKTENPVSAKLIDVSDISEMKGISTDNGFMTLGANISVEAAREALCSYYPQISDYLSCFASLQIRNKASLAGSIAGASPVGDIMPALLALKAKIKLSSVDSCRVVESGDFNVSYRKHIMKDNEIVESLMIPLPHKNSRFFAYKQSKRKDIDISSLTFCIGFVLTKGIMSEVSTGFGGMAAIPCPSKKIEDFLTGKPFTIETFIEAKSLIKDDFKPISDMRGSAEYRSVVAENLLIKCYNDLK